MAKRIIGWLLDAADRAALLARFPPAWPDAVAPIPIRLIPGILS